MYQELASQIAVTMDVENSLNKFNLDAENISRSSKKNKNALVIRKVICRYGTGCTHKLDPAHKEKFWHPVANKISGIFR